MRSFFWYDLETFGLSAPRSRIAQFAGQRTDLDLQPIGPPVELFCQPPDDLLPSPDACLVTGITPQQALTRGVPEPAFAAEVLLHLGEPGTCGVGYNSLRFDDEFVRYLLWRNLRDPYAREFRDGNARWDLLGMARLAHTLRPDGVVWPVADGRVGFRLEALAAANGLTHTNAHDAASDVDATLGLARLLRAAQPRLWAYHLAARDKAEVLRRLALGSGGMVLHAAGVHTDAHGCAALVLPLARLPTGRIVAVDLMQHPEPLCRLDAEALRQRVFGDETDAPRLRLTTIAPNRSPAVVPAAHVRLHELERLGIDPGRCQANRDRLRGADGLAERVVQVFARPVAEDTEVDCEQALYRGGFVGRDDRRLAQTVPDASPAELAAIRFDDPRLNALLLRYRARGWPQTLTPAERATWAEYRSRRLHDPALTELTLPAYRARIDALRQDGADPAVLDALVAWGERVAEVAAD